MGTSKRSISARLTVLLLAIALAVAIGPGAAMADITAAPAFSFDAQEEPTPTGDVTEAVDATDASRSVEGSVSVANGVFAAKVRGEGKGVKRTLDINGNVMNSTVGEKSIYSLVTYGFDGGEGVANVGGDVVAGSAGNRSQYKNANAVFSKADAGTLSVGIGGKVNAAGSGDVAGVWIEANGSKVTEKVTGGIAASSVSGEMGTFDAFGVYSQAENSSNVSVEVEENVAVQAGGVGTMTGCGAYLYSVNGSMNAVTVHGNIDAESSKTASGAKVSAGATSRSQLVVDGDIAATGACADLGAGVWLEASNGGTVDLLAKGTIHGKTVGLLFDGENGKNADSSAVSHFDITAWKIEVDEGGSLFAKGDYSRDVPDDVSSQVNYIVKVEQPLVGATITAVNDQKAPLVKSHGLDVARAGDKVYLDVALEPGYYLNNAYNGRGERVALQQDEGGYFLIVPEGGGVYLTVDVTQSKDSATSMSIVNGMAQYVFPYSDASVEGYTNASSDLYRFVVYVETDFDTDLDGKCDLVKTFVQVPRAAVEGKYEAPVIFAPDPYSAGMRQTFDSFKFENPSVDDVALMTKPNHREPSGSIATKDLALDPTYTKASDWSYKLDEIEFPNGISTYDYYLVRGFAIVQAAGLGTYGSEGIECCGTVMERDAFVDIVEWLHGANGRKAFADAAGTVEVKATDWSSGHVGMTGLSYPGAMCYEVATSGVEGLDTIVPLAGPSSWYDAHNSQGINTFSCKSYNYTTVLADTCASRLFENPDPRVLNLYQRYRTFMRNSQTELAGDYGPYWAARDWYTNQTGIKASALIVTGLNDNNVHTKHFDLMRSAFLASGCEVKTLLHQNEHVVPADENSYSEIMIGNHTYLEWLNLWFTHALLGEQNDASTLPAFTVQSNVDGSFYGSEAWNGDESVVIRPSGKGEATVDAAGASMNLGDMMETTFTGSASKNAALWSLPVNAQFTIAGKIPVHVRAKVNDVSEGDIPMSAVLIDVADTPFGAFAVNGSVQSEMVKKAKENSLSYSVVKWKQEQVKKKIVATGCIDLRNPEAGYEPATATKREQPIGANTYYDYTIYLDPTYYTVQAGHRLELYIVPFLDYTVYPSDEARDAILGKIGLDASSLMHLRTDYRFTIDNGSSFATLPVTDVHDRVDIAKAEVAAISAITYTGKAVKPSPKVTYQGKVLKEGVDYQLAYRNNKNAGTAAIAIIGINCYTGTKTGTFKIKKAAVKAAKVGKVKAQKYAGKAVKPNPKVSFKGKTLKRGTDYQLAYKNNKKRGTAKIIVKGKGNFKGKKVVKFKIK